MNAETPIRKKRAAAPVTFSRRAFVIGGALAASAGVAYARQPEVAAKAVDTDEFDSWVPEAVGQWRSESSSGVVLPPPDTLRDRLYDNLVTRVYVSGNRAPMMVLMAYNNAQDGVLQVHRPEVCYPVGGYTLTETENVNLDVAGKSIPSNFFTASAPNRVEHVLYYTRLGPAYPRTWAQQRLAVMRENLAGRIPDGILMRFSTLSSNRETALPDLEKFAGQFLLAAPAPLKKLLIA